MCFSVEFYLKFKKIHCQTSSSFINASFTNDFFSLNCNLPTTGQNRATGQQRCLKNLHLFKDYPQDQEPRTKSHMISSQWRGSGWIRGRSRWEMRGMWSLVPPVRKTFEWKKKKKKKKGNPGGLGGKLQAHNLVIWRSFQQDPTVKWPQHWIVQHQSCKNDCLNIKQQVTAPNIHWSRRDSACCDQ